MPRRKEDQPTTYRRFAVERRASYVVPGGTFESALMIIKDVFRDQTLGVSDTSYWSEFENNVTMKPKEACFQYYIAGVGHRELAKRLLNNFGSYRSGNVVADEQKELLGRLSNSLYRLYPQKYRESVKR